jgi:hypothetical protein
LPARLDELLDKADYLWAFFPIAPDAAAGGLLPQTSDF